ncbi:major facilitator superfamily domain-containing protein [Parachaetomium inaequale]|uniref:Major facilitator superfamily domain-containing protein n=1 Tax=Parachaetomium inaequale TaxID=2588326 RepID=A0AAN6PDX1_9PEZI|nr:major facilitator superfamily domain-containing protein [Parachaetomium inaequale]
MAAQSQSQASIGSGQSVQAAQAERQAEPGDAEKLSPPPSQPPPPPGSSEDELFKPRSVRFWLTLLCNFLALFLVALDRTVIATAVPRISDEFHALGDIGWYGSSYMLTTACAQLLFGRIYKFYDMKWSFLLSIIVFEIGSAICGAAPNSTAFIVGRAIAGLGSAGIFSGCLLIMIPMIPLHRRPAFQGLFGMVFGIASVMGPLIGGGFTGGVTWRWCFYINLPIGAVALVFMVLCWNPPKEKHEPANFTTHVKRLDPLGMIFFLPGVVCLFIAFQWAGSTYQWNEWRIILLLGIFAACTAAFVAVQILKPETASVPPKVIMQRSVAFGTGFTFFLAGSMLMLVYYVPVWFQTVKQVNPMQSGIYTLPLVLSLVVSSIASGGITQYIGYYVPSMLVAPSIMSIGEGLLSTLNRDSPTSHWVAFQFLAGFGLGFGMQTSGLAIQTVLPRKDVSTGIAINFFVQQLGGAVFTSVGQTILTNMLVSELSGLPGFDPKLVVQEGATRLAEIVGPDNAGLVIDAYNDACRHIFLASMGLAFASLLCAFGMEWKSIKKAKNRPRPPGPPGPPTPALPDSPSPALPDSPSPGTSSPDSSTGPMPGKPFFEGVVKRQSRMSKSSRRSSTVRPKTRDDAKSEKRHSMFEGRKQGVLTKPAPLEQASQRRPHSSANLSLAPAPEEKKDDMLAGALRDWARYSKAQEARREKAGLE